MGSPEGKILYIDIVSQNRLQTIKNREFRRNVLKIGSRILDVTPRGLPIERKLQVLAALFNDTLRSKISKGLRIIFVKKHIIFLLVEKPTYHRSNYPVIYRYFIVLCIHIKNNILLNILLFVSLLYTYSSSL